MGPFQESGGQRTASNPSAEVYAWDQDLTQYDTMMPSNDGIPSMFDESGAVLHDDDGFFDRTPISEAFEPDALANLEHTVFPPEDTGIPGFDGSHTLLDIWCETGSAGGNFGWPRGYLPDTHTLDWQDFPEPEHIVFPDHSDMGESQTSFSDEVSHNNLQCKCGRGKFVCIYEMAVDGVVRYNQKLFEESQRLAQENKDLLEDKQRLERVVEGLHKTSQGQKGDRYQEGLRGCRGDSVTYDGTMCFSGP